jgi:hypothetical protein
MIVSIAQQDESKSEVIISMEIGYLVSELAPFPLLFQERGIFEIYHD